MPQARHRHRSVRPTAVMKEVQREAERYKVKLIILPTLKAIEVLGQIPRTPTRSSTRRVSTPLSPSSTSKKSACELSPQYCTKSAAREPNRYFASCF
jgi:hypothetical protein